MLGFGAARAPIYFSPSFSPDSGRPSDSVLEQHGTAGGSADSPLKKPAGPLPGRGAVCLKSQSPILARTGDPSRGWWNRPQRFPGGARFADTTDRQSVGDLQILRDVA
jgi:hypothetical protein